MVKKSAKKFLEEPEKKLDSISAIDEELKSLEVNEKIAEKDIAKKRSEIEEAVSVKKDISTKRAMLKRKKQALEVDEFKRNMYEELGINPLVPLVEDFYIISWNDGHSYGMQEVKNHMIDYVDIIAKIERVNKGLQDLHIILTSEIVKAKDKSALTALDNKVIALIDSWSEKS